MWEECEKEREKEGGGRKARERQSSQERETGLKRPPAKKRERARECEDRAREFMDGVRKEGWEKRVEKKKGKESEG
eukprot:1392111-Amorphochlora_amoeboformis.AAC.1